MSPASVCEAVPNFSEGRDPALVAALASGPEVLDVHADAEHDRCVVTLALADLDRLCETLFARTALAVERIDLRTHAGLHPRVGAADVLPLVPLGEASMADAVVAARRLGERIWRELRVPVCFYAEAAGGRTLADIRAGRVPPDLGAEPHPTAGIACVGARPPLVAYNLVLPGISLARAGEIASRMRALPGVQALAFALAGGRAQLSMNLTRPSETGVAAAFEQAARLAGAPGEPELVGLCPAAAAGPGCDGALLEARLAAAAADGTLAGTRATPEAIREAAELVEALIGTSGDPEREAMLRVAAAGLRAAVDG